MNTLVSSAKTWANAALGFLYPEVCQLCLAARATPAEGFVCAGCRDQVRFIAPPFCERCGHPYEGAITSRFQCAKCADRDFEFSSARAAVAARDPVLEAIHRFKYNRALWFEPFLAQLLIAQASAELSAQKWDLIVPVPLHATKLREREFNQAERLAVRLSRATAIPCAARVLQRTRPTQTQTRLSRDERQANVRNAFRVRKSAHLDGERIVLVDDVFTTGATTNACAKALRAGGASEVCVWTVARGI